MSDTIFAPGIGTENNPVSLVAVVPGPNSDPRVYYNIVAVGAAPVQINAQEMYVGGGLYVDLDNGNDAIRVQPFRTNPIPGPLFPQLPNTLYMLGGEISMDREGGGGNDLIKIDAESPYYYKIGDEVQTSGDGGPTKEINLGLYMGAYPGVGIDNFGPPLLISPVSGAPGAGDFSPTPVPSFPPPFLPLPPSLPFFFPAVGGNSILMGEGNDTMVISSGDAGSGIAGDGLIMDGEGTGDGNLIQFGAGQDLLQISATEYGLGMFGSSNYIYMGDDSDTLSVNMSQVSSVKRETVDASGNKSSSECETAGIIIAGGDNGIEMQLGDDLISVSGAADYGIYNTTGTIYTGQGNDEISVDNDKGYGIYMSSSGVIGLGAGDDTITSNSKDSALELYYGSLVKTGAGNDLLKLTSNNPKGNSAVAVSYASQILMGIGNDSLIVDNFAKPGSENSAIDLEYAGKIDTGEGDDFVSVRQVGSDQSSNGIRLDAGSSFYLGSGNDTVKIESDRDGLDLEADVAGGNLFDLGEGNDLLDIDNRNSKTENGVEVSESVFAAGSGDDTVKIISGGGGFDAEYSTITFGTGNNLLDIDANAADQQAIDLDYSTMTFGEAEDGPGDDTIKILTSSGVGIELDTSSLTLGGGNNLIDIQSNKTGIDLESGSNIVFGQGSDTLKVRQQANGFNGIDIDDGSGIYMSNGANLIDVQANGDDAIQITNYSKLVTGSDNDTILAKGIETSDRSKYDSGIELGNYSGLFTDAGNDLIQADATYGIQVLENSGIDTGFGLDTIIAKGNLQAGIQLVSSSINTGNNFDLIQATSTNDYALRTGTFSDSRSGSLSAADQEEWELSFASINTGRGADTVSLIGGGGGWSTNGGGSINLGAGQDLLVLGSGGAGQGGSYDVVSGITYDWCMSYLSKVTDTNGMAPTGAAFANFGRGAEDTLRLGEGFYNVVYLPDVFEGLYAIIDEDFDILAVTNLEFIGGVSDSGDITKPTVAFPTSGGSVASFTIFDTGVITT